MRVLRALISIVSVLVVSIPSTTLSQPTSDSSQISVEATNYLYSSRLSPIAITKGSKGLIPISLGVRPDSAIEAYAEFEDGELRVVWLPYTDSQTGEEKWRPMVMAAEQLPPDPADSPDTVFNRDGSLALRPKKLLRPEESSTYPLGRAIAVGSLVRLPMFKKGLPSPITISEMEGMLANREGRIKYARNEQALLKDAAKEMFAREFSGFDQKIYSIIGMIPVLGSFFPGMSEFRELGSLAEGADTFGATFMTNFYAVGDFVSLAGAASKGILNAGILGKSRVNSGSIGCGASCEPSPYHTLLNKSTYVSSQSHDPFETLIGARFFTRNELVSSGVPRHLLPKQGTYVKILSTLDPETLGNYLYQVGYTPSTYYRPNFYYVPSDLGVLKPNVGAFFAPYDNAIVVRQNWLSSRALGVDLPSIYHGGVLAHEFNHWKNARGRFNIAFMVGGWFDEFVAYSALGEYIERIARARGVSVESITSKLGCDYTRASEIVDLIKLGGRSGAGYEWFVNPESGPHVDYARRFLKHIHIEKSYIDELIYRTSQIPAVEERIITKEAVFDITGGNRFVEKPVSRTTGVTPAQIRAILP